MKLNNLIEVELYRFWRSPLSYLGMLIGSALLVMGLFDNSDMLLGGETLAENMSATMRLANIMIALLAAVCISVYIGREYKQKTIHYELMSGCSMVKIAITKTVTCGLISAAIMVCGLMIFYISMPGALALMSGLRIVSLYVALFRVCACISLWIIICRNGAVGGCIGFVRFTLFEVIILFIAEMISDGPLYNLIRNFSMMVQWNTINYFSEDLPLYYFGYIIFSTILEYAFLLGIVRLSSRKTDY